MKKKVLSLLLATTMVVSMTACGGSSNDSASSSTDTSSTGDTSSTSSSSSSSDTADTSTADASTDSDIEKPDEITILVDGTVFTQPNARDQFMAKLEELIGIKINVISLTMMLIMTM